MNRPTEKLSETKRQHYVPRMLLRNFTKDGKRISLIVDGKRIDGASIGKQCYGDYFYGSDNVMEKSFSDSEAKMLAFLPKYRTYASATSASCSAPKKDRSVKTPSPPKKSRRASAPSPGKS